MSQPASPRSQRSVAGMVVALVVVAVISVGVVWYRGSDDEPAPRPSVDWQAWVKAGRSEQDLMIYAPTRLPDGWHAQAANYSGGLIPRWHLALLTDSGKYIGIDEARGSTEDLVKEIVDKDAERGTDVDLAGETWQTWTDAGGDYALVRSVEVGGQPYESVLIGGSAPADEIEAFAGSLTSGTIRTG